ncbi:MAG: PilZ domain-containing protein [Thermodesulfobacteriaceae bacterium]|nr:PilZ domain-containing protein [Thermodesulfobacteriaceae bacterium]
MPEDKRFYSRYKINLESRASLPLGINFNLEVLDISVEGAKLRADRDLSIQKGDIVFLLIKAPKKLKVKGEVRWTRKEGRGVEFGVKFVEVDMAIRETLASIISEYALSSLSDEYFK